MTIAEIERRLRFAAPDEPAVLPTLALPTGGQALRRAGVRLRPRRGTPRDVRLVYVVAALLLALALAITAGAIRLLNDSETPPIFGDRCEGGSALGVGTDPECLSVAVPDGWTVLGSGQLVPGDYTEVGLGYEYVEVVMASTPLGACASPGGPFPTAIPVGSNTYEQPYPTPDAGLWCLRSAPLPANGIRVETMHGMRISGVVDGAGVADTSEPTEAAGWTEIVAGRPARLVVTSGGPGRPAETRTWDVLYPGAIDRVLRIRADLAGPDLEAGRLAVQSIVDSVTFRTTAIPLDAAKADEVLRRVLDGLDRGARQQHSDYYVCFPREPGSADGLISRGLFDALSEPLAVTCSTAMSQSLAGVWRITLDVTWEASGDDPGGTVRQEFFTDGSSWGDDVVTTGGYLTSLTGRALSPNGSYFPSSAGELPPPLAGPLNLPLGSLVQMLWPGDEPAEEPGNASDTIAPIYVGLHLYVLDGPRVIDGEEWYQVQWADMGWGAETAWVRGTRDGRPQLEVIDPACPSVALTIDELTWLAQAERLLCFGGGDVTIRNVVAEQGEPRPIVSQECGDEHGTGPCPTNAGDPAWLTAASPWKLFGPDGSAGPSLPLVFWLPPSLAPPPVGVPLDITGHFDDPGASGCRWGGLGTSGTDPGSPEVAELLCRERFVVTAIEPR